MSESLASSHSDSKSLDWRHDATLDTSGLRCPLPVLKARKKLLSMERGQRLLLVATDPMSALDVPHFCNEAGHRLIATQAGDEAQRYLIEKD